MSERPQELASEAAQLRVAVGDLADRMTVTQEQTRLLRRLTLGVTVLAVVGIVCGVILGVTLVQQANRTNRFLQEGGQSRASIALVRDCIDPAGVCARRQAASTAKAINQIVDSNHNGKADTQEILDALNAK